MAVYHSRLQLVVATALLVSLVSLEALSQTLFPHIALKGKTLRNNSWIEAGTLLGDDELQCVTDLGSCCIQGMVERAWILPNRTELSKDGVQEISSFNVSAGPQQLGLKLLEINTALPGVYECSIATRTAAVQSVYVGIYHSPDVGELHIEELLAITISHFFAMPIIRNYVLNNVQSRCWWVELSFQVAQFPPPSPVSPPIYLPLLSNGLSI